MLKDSRPSRQMSFNATFEEQLNHKHPLYVLAGTINWKHFEETFAKPFRPTTNCIGKSSARVSPLHGRKA
jgi:hypothetical protein